MPNLFQFANRSKPQVPIDQYATVFRNALEGQYAVLVRESREDQYPNPAKHGFPDRLSALYDFTSGRFKEVSEVNPADPAFTTPDGFQKDFFEYVKFQAAEWDQMNQRREALEALRPDARLNHVHEELVKWIRGCLEVANAGNAMHAAIYQRDPATLSKANRDRVHWGRIFDQVGTKLGKALRDLRNNQPDLYAALNLSPESARFFDSMSEF